VSNHPNPFNGSTTVSFELKEAVSNVQFSVYDVLGNLVHAEKLASSKGTNTHVFSAEGLSSGIYVYTIADGANTITRKMNIQ
jgi:hypothetical protein